MGWVTKYKPILKGVSIVCGIGLCILGGFGIGALDVTRPISFILPIYYVIFGVMMIAGEFGFKFLTKYFSFMQNFIGRGSFWFFVGSLCLRGPIYNYIVGAVIMLIGLIFLCCYCALYSEEMSPSKEDEG